MNTMNPIDIKPTLHSCDPAKIIEFSFLEKSMSRYCLFRAVVVLTKKMDGHALKLTQNGEEYHKHFDRYFEISSRAYDIARKLAKECEELRRGAKRL